MLSGAGALLGVVRCRAPSVRPANTSMRRASSGTGLYRAGIIVPRIKALDREHVATSSEPTSHSPACTDTSRSACPVAAVAASVGSARQSAFRGSLTFLALR
jgi:hypothetical protein